MCYTIYVTFLPLFMKEDLGFSSQSIGFHFGLLWTIGIVASPLMGHLSDRLGRKPVLVPALLCSGTLTVILALFGKGIMFTLIIGMLGIFLRSDYALLSAAILDIVGQKVATTMLGLVYLTQTLGASATSTEIFYLEKEAGELFKDTRSLQIQALKLTESDRVIPKARKQKLQPLDDLRVLSAP